jgi:hypothetical protein
MTLSKLANFANVAYFSSFTDKLQIDKNMKSFYGDKWNFTYTLTNKIGFPYNKLKSSLMHFNVKSNNLTIFAVTNTIEQLIVS